MIILIDADVWSCDHLTDAKHFGPDAWHVKNTQHSMTNAEARGMATSEADTWKFMNKCEEINHRCNIF